MNRKNLVKIHLIIASLFLPFLLVIPLSGTMYLLGYKGKNEKAEMFQVNKRLSPTDEEIRKVFSQNQTQLSYDYIKHKGDLIILRPSTRPHYEIRLSEDESVIYKVKPDLIKSLVEMHKGHGPQYFRILEIIFGIGLILLTISGLILTFGIKSFINLSLIPFGLGFILFFATLLL